MRHPPGTRLCACDCGQSLDGYRRDAKWRSEACEKRWRRAHPGRSAHEASVGVVGPTKPRRKSGVSIRIAARGAIDAMVPLLARAGYSDADAREHARIAVLPLVAPQHRSLL